MLSLAGKLLVPGLAAVLAGNAEQILCVTHIPNYVCIAQMKYIGAYNQSDQFHI